MGKAGQRYTPPKETVNGIPILGAAKVGISSKQARTDTCALLIGKLMEVQTGDRYLIADTMEHLFESPERLGAVTLALMNYTAQLTLALRGPGGLQELIDGIIMEVGKM